MFSARSILQVFIPTTAGHFQLLELDSEPSVVDFQAPTQSSKFYLPGTILQSSEVSPTTEVTVSKFSSRPVMHKGPNINKAPSTPDYKPAG